VASTFFADSPSFTHEKKINKKKKTADVLTSSSANPDIEVGLRLTLWQYPLLGNSFINKIIFLLIFRNTLNSSQNVLTQCDTFF
jgi:hypothetical protein